MKIIFFGSGYFGLSILRSLVNLHQQGKLEIKAIVSQPAKIFGRSQIILDNLVAKFCKESGYSHLLLTPTRLIEIEESLVNVDLGIVASYGKILPSWLINSFRFGLINFHASLLPKYRGAVPIQAMLLNQDYQALGISVIKIDETLDGGDIILKAKLDIPYENFINITASELMKIAAEFASSLLINNYEYLLNPSIWILEKQDESCVSYCYLSDLKKENFQILFSDSCFKAHGKIMAGNPDPKAFVIIKDKVFNLLRSKLHLNQNNKVCNLNNIVFFTIANKLFINLADSTAYLEILEIQPEGKKNLNSNDFINGYKKFIINC